MNINYLDLIDSIAKYENAPAWGITAKALLEVNRLDLVYFTFPVKSTPHFESNQHWLMVEKSISCADMGYLTMLLEEEYPLLAKARLDPGDFALIERAMALGFKGAGLTYECGSCDYAFYKRKIKLSDLTCA